ncbi:unnamed protein product [Callosobruchus maculatus]|uniref:Protein sleepless n=2 Tax=Callosobruchus maculatus TaxID=64391 RepID=A0A653C753_CALMS|nr:unnamed protein product [Callosobruchus maculatus]
MTKSIYGVLACIFQFFFDEVYSIDCFKCISINGEYPPCEDPFHNNYTTEILHSPCMGGRKGRDGLFPATSCIKITGIIDETGEKMILRGCALDSGTLTTDTEIVRMSHCGGFYYDGKYVKGCVQSCNDVDACNSAKQEKPPLFSFISLNSIVVACHFISFM